MATPSATPAAQPAATSPSTPAHAEAHAPAAPHAEAPHSGKVSKVGKAAGVVGVLLGAAGAANAAPSGHKLDAVLNTAPGVEEARKGNYLGAAVQAIGSLDPTMGFGEAALNKAARSLGINVPKSGLEQASESAVRIPHQVLQENIRMYRVGEGLLKDAGLGEKDKSGKSAADYLRDPSTRDAYLGSLKESLKATTDPKAGEALGFAVEAAEKFCEIEGRRMAKLAPHGEKMSEQFASALKAQHLAAQFKQENPEAAQLAHGGQAAQSIARSAQAPNRGTAASRG